MIATINKAIIYLESTIDLNNALTNKNANPTPSIKVDATEIKIIQNILMIFSFYILRYTFYSIDLYI